MSCLKRGFRSVFLTLTVAVGSLLVPELALATTYYCNLATGSDLWDGKSETYTSGKNGPFKTFNYAQGKLRNGDVS